MEKEKIEVDIEGEGVREVSLQALKEGRIPLILDQESSNSRIYSKIKKGDILLFDFSGRSEDGKRILLFSIRRRGERVLLKNDDKLFLGIFADDKNKIKTRVMELIIFLEAILDIRMSFSIDTKKGFIIAAVT